MTAFWKRPKFWLILILLIWFAWIISANLGQTFTIFLIPGLIAPVVGVSLIIVVSMIFGVIITLLVQLALRRRASKLASASMAAGDSNNKTTA